MTEDNSVSRPHLVLEDNPDAPLSSEVSASCRRTPLSRSLIPYTAMSQAMDSSTSADIEPRSSPYRSILGAKLDSLSPALRTMHDRGGSATGRFDVTGGERLMHRLLARMFDLPREGTNLPVHLDVTPSGRRQHWDRTIGTHAFRSVQWDESGTLVEQVGAFRFHFRLSVTAGALHFMQERATWRGCSLPSWCAPTVTAIATGTSDSGWRVKVIIRSAGFGIITRYEGVMESV